MPVKPGAPVGAYSVGVQQSIEIAKALAFEARILVMDEPTSALTEPEVERLFEVMASLKRAGCGIIYISHKMEEIYRIADRITVLRDGRYIGTEDRDKLPRETLVKWMIGRPMTNKFSGLSRRRRAPRAELKDGVPEPAGRPARRRQCPPCAGRNPRLGGTTRGARSMACTVFTAGTRAAKSMSAARLHRIPPRALRRSCCSNDRKREGTVPSMSVIHNIRPAALPRFSPGGLLRRPERRAAEALGGLHIRVAALTREVATLSGGNQRSGAGEMPASGTARAAAEWADPGWMWAARHLCPDDAGPHPVSRWC